MPLIEKFTPGGNMYPDGQSTFVVLVSLFQKLAENRDTRDAAQKAAWEAADATERTARQQGDANTLSSAQSDATTKANAAEASAKTYTDQAVDAVDVDLTGYATETYAATAADTARADANTYTDNTFLATPAGQSSDAAIDAGIERARTAGRIGSVALTQVDVGIYRLESF